MINELSVTMLCVSTKNACYDVNPLSVRNRVMLLTVAVIRQSVSVILCARAFALV